MYSKTQSVGNLIASASWKARCHDGVIEGIIPALGRITVGEVMEFTAIRLRIGEREIPGALESAEWRPWEVRLETPECIVRRSTSADDRHMQWFDVISSSSGPMTIWIEFRTHSPLRLYIDEGIVYWESELSRVVAIGLDPMPLRISAGKDEQSVEAKLEDEPRAIVGPTWACVDGRDGRGIVAFRLPPGSSARLGMVVSETRRVALKKLRSTMNDSEQVVFDSKSEWEAFFEQMIPTNPCASYEDVWREAWYVLRANRMNYGTPPLAQSFTCPSKFNYTHQWLWDSAFHSIIWRWTNRVEWASGELDNLLDNPLENGRICHEIYFSPWLCEQGWNKGRKLFAPTSQPPVLAMAIERVFQRTGDLNWIRKVLPVLVGYLTWWSIARDPDKDDLAGWGTAWESGLDDSPRWDHVSRGNGSTWFPQPLEATELNGLLVNEWRTVARLALLLQNREVESHAKSCADRIKAAMLDRLWNANDEFFYCLDHQERPVHIKTIGGLLGLLALDPGDVQVDGILRHLTDEREFWTPYPVPSVARNEPSFTTGQMWRGPTWINTNWLLIRALQRLNRDDIARSLSDRTLEMVRAEGIPKLWEWYDPLSGRALGNMDYGWSALVIDLLMDRPK